MSGPRRTPIRCAHVVATAGATGVERHIEALLAGFDRAEVEPTLFVPGPGPLVEQARARGIEVEFGAPVRKLALGAARGLAARLRGAFDLVHSHGPRATFWARRAASAASLPIIATIHELRRETLPPGPRRAAWVALEEHDLARVDGLIAVSEFVRAAVLERHADWAARLSVVHGTTPLLLDPAPTRPPRGEGGPLRIVSIGRLEWVKRHDLVLRALAELARRGVMFHLTLIGHGQGAADLRALARTLGIAAHVRWVDQTAKPSAMLIDADVFISASRSETLGLAVVEAMACGTFVVAARVGALAELPGAADITLVDPLPESSLTDRLVAALEAVHAAPEDAAAAARRAGGRVRERLAPARIAAATSAVYRDVLERWTRARG